MHEFSLAQAMLETAQEQARAHGATRILRVVVRIGALSGVVPDALSFSFEALTAETAAAGARLEIEEVPAVCRCAACDRDFEVVDYSYQCPACGQTSRELRRGREMYVSQIEVS